MHGSLEALVSGLEDIRSDKVDLEVIGQGVGNITKSDVTLASAGDATIVGFNVKLDNGVQSLAKHEDVSLIQNAIIYELLDQVEEAMVDLLEAEVVEKKSGAAEVDKYLVFLKVVRLLVVWLQKEQFIALVRLASCEKVNSCLKVPLKPYVVSKMMLKKFVQVMNVVLISKDVMNTKRVIF